MLTNQMSTLPVRKECGSRFSGGPSRFPQDTFARFQQRKIKIQVTCTFRAMTSKVVGFHKDAPDCWVFTSQTPQRNNCLRRIHEM